VAEIALVVDVVVVGVFGGIVPARLPAVGVDVLVQAARISGVMADRVVRVAVRASGWCVCRYAGVVSGRGRIPQLRGDLEERVAHLGGHCPQLGIGQPAQRASVTANHRHLLAGRTHDPRDGAGRKRCSQPTVSDGKNCPKPTR
jgi:hypothetical protein